MRLHVPDDLIDLSTIQRAFDAQDGGQDNHDIAVGHQQITGDKLGNAISVALATERNSAMNLSELADLNAFVVVANHLSFRAASAQLGVTASALSHSMRHLEERLGARLLHRTTRSVSLTDAALRLLEQLRRRLIRFPALWKT
jgi:Bacterial regulatory helix-turn-helix protein, lysR family